VTDHTGSRWPVVVAVAAGMLLTGVTLGFALASGIAWQQFVQSYTLTNLVIGLAFLGSGAPVAWLTRNVVGRLLVTAGLCHLISAAATMMAMFGLNADWPNFAIRVLSTFSTGAWQFGIGLLFPLALLLFPDGHLPSRRWVWVAWLIMLGGAFQAVTGVLSDGSAFGDSPEFKSVLSIGLEMPEAVVLIAGIASDAAYALVIAALVWRFIRGDERTRRQLMWLILAMLIILTLNAERFLTGDGPILLLLSVVLIPIALAIAIVRYQLFDIRVVLSRTLLYGLTIALVIGVYVGVVAGFMLLVPSSAQRSVSVAAAIVVAFLFAPLRSLIQRMINRAFYGTRSDPARTASRIGEGLRQDDDLPGVLEQTRSALRLPWISLRGEPGGNDIAAAGTLQESPSVEMPLTYRGEQVGTLVVGLRRGDRDLHDADRRTLDLIATPLAVALHATALSDQVQQARTAIVEAAAAERVRLQRELHDGVGPILTSAAFQADAASNLIHTDPDGAERLIDEIRIELRGAIDDVRRVVYGLRPIELDNAGLVGALRQRLVGLPGEAGQIRVEMEHPDQLPALSPAVELAAYRIASEAINNALTHSEGRRCLVKITANGTLAVTVRDDGRPPSSWTPGVGLRSILERAEELGGTAAAGPIGDGWEVRARLPLDGLAPSVQDDFAGSGR
jgi:two-component system, NarL family, sensor kinase